MSVVYEQILKKSLEKGNLHSNYFIFGDDGYLKKKYVDEIIDKTVARDDDFNFMRFNEDCDLQDVYDAKEQFPMLSDKKCVVLCDYDFEHAKASDFERLQELLSDRNDKAVFIYWCNSVEVDVKRSEKAKKLITAVENGGGLAVQLNYRSNVELEKMLKDGAVRRGTHFENGAASYLIETSSQDINILKFELEKLCAYAGTNPITQALIDEICIKNIDVTVYNLAGEIFSMNLTNALKLLDGLFDLRIEPYVILYNISAAFIDAYRVYSAKSDGVGIPEVSKIFAYSNRSFLLERAEKNLRRIDRERLGLCFQELIWADSALKGFSAHGRTVLEQLIVKLIYIISKGEKIDKTR